MGAVAPKTNKQGGQRCSHPLREPEGLVVASLRLVADSNLKIIQLGVGIY